MRQKKGVIFPPPVDAAEAEEVAVEMLRTDGAAPVLHHQTFSYISSSSSFFFVLFNLAIHIEISFSLSLFGLSFILLLFLFFLSYRKKNLR